ncbi:prophage repressor [Sphingomonas sp. MM-1]|uniref:helix-turn-helix domain-containing protein n=1 Tax=Sphingomonas sp. MM-1 TaxID=745310 RepID=UPI0002C0FBFC|nr:helix-turn-helix domain-containing protein [Sphingomonas sp. MM-1]AGH48741.1 prophage repressor [Sphingomonas sp. MM-1]
MNESGHRRLAAAKDARELLVGKAMRFEIVDQLHTDGYTDMVYCNASVYSVLDVTLPAPSGQYMPMRYSLQLKKLRNLRKMTQSALAEAVGVEQPTIQRWESGARTPDMADILRLAAALGVEPGELFAEGPLVALGPRLYVKGVVAAGVWKEVWEYEPDEWEVFTGRADVAAPVRDRFGLRVEGDSMDIVYPHGTIVECVAYWGEAAIPNGKRVVVQRRRVSQDFETTVKEYRIDGDGREWLIPRSNNPAFQRPIEIGHDEDDIEEVRIIALVVGSYRPE